MYIILYILVINRPYLNNNIPTNKTYLKVIKTPMVKIIFSSKICSVVKLEVVLFPLRN